LRDDLADLVRPALDAQPVGPAHRLLAVEVEADDRNREDAPRPPRHAADTAGGVVEIEQDGVALGRRIELADVANGEPAANLLPDVGPETVAAAEAELVQLFLRV